MNNILVEFNHGWADEFDVYGLAIMPAEEFEKLLKRSYNGTYYFGTNEGWESEDLSDGFRIKSKDPAVIATFSTTLRFRNGDYENIKTWGNFPGLYDYGSDEEDC